MRISLNQKPNSSKDFGFEAAWDSTGARVTSVQKGKRQRARGSRSVDESLTSPSPLKWISLDFKPSSSILFSDQVLLVNLCRFRNYVGQIYVGRTCPESFLALRFSSPLHHFFLAWIEKNLKRLSHLSPCTRIQAKCCKNDNKNKVDDRCVRQANAMRVTVNDILGTFRKLSSNVFFLTS